MDAEHVKLETSHRFLSSSSKIQVLATMCHISHPLLVDNNTYCEGYIRRLLP